MDLARSALPAFVTPDARLAAGAGQACTIGDYGWNQGNLTAFLAVCAPPAARAWHFEVESASA